MKADKSKIIQSQSYEDIRCDKLGKNCVDYGQAVKYLYISDKKVKDDKNELKDKRTKNTKFFENNGVYTARVYSGEPFYNDNGEWYETETATTTVKAFNQQTRSLISRVYASTFPTVDGRVRSFDADWATAYSGSNLSAMPTDATGYLHTDNESGTFYINQGFFTFDTSALTASASISSATFYLKCNDGSYGSGNFWRLVQSTQASPTDLTTSDFMALGSTAGSDTDRENDSFSSGTYQSWALNATGIGWINKTGYTLLALRETAYDIANSAPPTSQDKWVGVYFSETAGTDSDPYLDITYTLGGGCSYSGTGDWYVNSGDNCYIQSDVYVSGDLNLVNTGSGSFNLINNAKIMAKKINNTSTPINGKAGTKIELY